MITHLVRLYPTLQYEIILSSILLPGDNMKPLKEKVSITIDTPVLEKIRYLAEQDDRPLSSYINLVLREHLEKLKNK